MQCGGNQASANSVASMQTAISQIEMVLKKIIENFQFSNVRERSGNGARPYIIGVLVVDQGTLREVLRLLYYCSAHKINSLKVPMML